MQDWSPSRYLAFEEERTRPAVDLLARVPAGTRQRIADLGCGPGNSTQLLCDRFPEADIIGLDSSEEMLAKARMRLPTVKFLRADVTRWSGPGAFNLLFANAVLHWAPDHIALMAEMMTRLKP